MKVLEGNLVAEGLKIGIVAARFNEFIVSKLIGGAEDALKRHGVREEDIELAWVPGAFEIPLIAQKMAHSKKYDAVICLGAVIKGATSHYDYVCAAHRRTFGIPRQRHHRVAHRSHDAYHLQAAQGEPDSVLHG